jgi:hypothetical protein
VERKSRTSTTTPLFPPALLLLELLLPRFRVRVSIDSSSLSALDSCCTSSGWSGSDITCNTTQPCKAQCKRTGKQSARVFTMCSLVAMRLSKARFSFSSAPA